MKILRFGIFVMLSVCLIVSTIGSGLFGASMLSVHAVAPTALGLDVMYSICEYLGYTTLTYTCGRELPEISSDDAAKLGHDLMMAIYGHDAVFQPDDPIYQIPMPDGTMAVVTSDGQSYVFGTEALQEVAETDFTVIQGGKNDGGDDDDDDNNDDDNIIHFPKTVAEAGKKAFAFTVGGALMFSELVSTVYHDWINGEENNLLDPFFEIYPSITDTGIKNQWSGLSYTLSGFQAHEKWVYYFKDYNVYTTPVAYYITEYTDHISVSRYCLRSLGSSTIDSISRTAADYVYTDGSGKPGGHVTAVNSMDTYLSLSVNVPVFSSYEEVKEYLLTGAGYENASNYVKEYRNADWLQDDWLGKLLDPLTGLNALSNWYNIARHQGLNALGDNPSADDIGDYLRDYFAQNGTDVLPEVDPMLAPIKYPSTLPDVVIDPAKNPAVSPVADPDPGTDPSPGVDPDPGIDPTPNPGTVVDIPIEDIVPTVNDSFGDIAAALKYKFPFSIPWDIHHIFTVLADTPKAPYFELPLVIERYGINEKIVIDMSRFQVLSNLSRSMFSMLFSILLINLTFKVVAMRKEE